jgi:hypothetical protein
MNGGFDKPDIARAIRRATQARLAMRKRRRRALAAVIGLPLSAVIGFGMWTASASGVDVAQVAARHAADLVDLLNQRSPGARTAAQLTKTKRLTEALNTKGPPAPSRSILAKPPSLADLLAAPVDISLPQISESFAPLEQSPLPAISIALSGGDAGSSPLFPPGTESTASVPPGESKIPIVDTPAVPEPQSWALMLLGFALVGWKVRGRVTSATTKRIPSPS